MKLGPVTKLYKRNTVTSKELDDDALTTNNDFAVIFRLMATLEQSGNRVPGIWSAEIINFKEVLVLKAIFSETTCMWCTYVPKFKHNPKEF